MSEDRARARVGQALALIKQGAVPAAEALLASMCEQNADDAKAWFMRGTLSCESGDTKRAIEYLSITVRLEPDNTQAHFTLCKLHYSTGNLVAATHHVEKVVVLDPQHAHAWLALGSLYADCGKFEQSEQASRVAMELLPGVAEPRINLANALISQVKHDEAIQLCCQIKAQNPRGPGIWYSLGLAFKTLGKPLDAEQCMTSVAQLAPDHAQAHCVLGEIMAARGQPEQALSLYKRARMLAPSDAMVHFQIGKVLVPTSSPRHARWVERLQENYQYNDAEEAADVARELAAGFDFGNREVEVALVRFFDEFDPSRLYPTAWWTDALKQFGDPRQAFDTALRSIFSAVFSFSLPCRQALAGLAAFCGKRMASYGSGSGYWEWLLANHHGLEVSCHDLTLRHRFLPMQMASHADAYVAGDTTIFLAWLPGDAAIDADIESLLGRLKPGQKLVLVGESDDNGHPRTCATQRFFRYLRHNFEHQATLPLVNYAYLEDRIDLLVKRY
jgi:predicted Zn-dependent protease